MTGPPPAALPSWWHKVPFGDPVWTLVAEGKVAAPCGSAAARKAAALAGLPFAALAAHAGSGRTVNLLLRAADGAAWRLECELGADGTCLRAEAIATSIARAEQYLHFELSRRLAEGLRHEMSGPLSVLSLDAQLLGRSLPKGEASAAAALERMLPSMLARLADLGRLQDRLVEDWQRMDNVPRPVAPAALLEELQQLCRAWLAGLPARFDVQPRGALHPLHICPRRLKWILLAGILSTAQRAGPGATLRLETGTEAGRLVFEMASPASANGHPAAPVEEDPPAALAAAGALAWGLAEGRDGLEVRADGGWRLSLDTEDRGAGAP